MANLARRLSVILCADVVGYSRLMGIDEEGTLSLLKAARRDLIDPRINEHGGRLVRTMGDGLLVEFRSVLDAVRCALAVQEAMRDFGPDLPAERRIRFRMAVNIGDVVTQGDDIYGDGLTVASHMESLAEPGSVNISRAVRDQVHDRLPVGFVDLGDHRVKNVAHAVRVFRIIRKDEGGPALPASRKAAAAPPAKPGLAVLPFRNFGGDAESEFFLDSIAEDLITELSRARWFSVLARNTSFSYKGKEVDSKQVAREQGVRYVIEGSLRIAGPRVRITCQLVDAASGEHLWAERFDGTLEESFELQDAVTEKVIGSIAPVLRSAEIERARQRPDSNLDVYDLTLRALGPAFAETADAAEEALRILAQALAMRPAYPTANALAGWCRQQRHLLGWPGAQEDDREAAKRLARVAIAEGSEVPLALAIAGAVRAALTRDHDLALAAADHALALSPNSAVVLGFAALTRCLCGSYEAAATHAETALRLSPGEPLIYIAAFALALARLLAGRDEEAAAHARKAIEGNRNFAFSYCALALACARLDQRRDALQALRELRHVAPGFRIGTLRRIRFADEARLQADLALLRAAGLPE